MKKSSLKTVLAEHEKPDREPPGKRRTSKHGRGQWALGKTPRIKNRKHRRFPATSVRSLTERMGEIGLLGKA